MNREMAKNIRRLKFAFLTVVPGNLSSQRLSEGHTLAGLLGMSTATGLEETVISGASS